MRFASVAGRGAIVVGDEAFDVNENSDESLPSDPTLLLAHHFDELRALDRRLTRGAGTTLQERDLRSPVPNPRSIFGLVANYPPAIRPTPAVPMVFGKFPSSVVGPFDDIELPDPASLPMGAEWTVLEAELAVVIGLGGRHIAEADALDRVAGFTIAQDITERMHEFGRRGSSVGTMDYESLKALGKSVDTFCPLGPMLVTLDEFDEPLSLDIECRLNGEVVQKASTGDQLLMGLAELVSFLSSFVTLRSGDVILTGTPTPLGGQLPRLSDGDVIETEISGIGLMRNRCTRAAVTDGPKDWV